MNPRPLRRLPHRQIWLHARSAAALIALAGSAHALPPTAFPPTAFPPTISPVALNGANGFTFHGVDDNDRSGFPLSSIGDVNGDGIDDIIIGAYPAEPPGFSNTGECYVVFGAPGVGTTGTFELSALDGMNGFTIHGAVANDFAGTSVSWAGDVNGDNIDDLLVGATGAGIEGEAYVIFGDTKLGLGGLLDLGDLDGSNGFAVIGSLQSHRSRVFGVGDVNGDGFDDVLYAEPYADANAISNTGQAYLVFGGAAVGSSGSVDLATLAAPAGFGVPGPAAGDLLGWGGGRVGDINTDGIDDLAIGVVNGGSAEQGGAYLLFGDPTLGASGTIDLLALTPDAGLFAQGVSPGDDCGIFLAGAGDLNGDGVDDLAIGANRADPGGVFIAGEAYVVFGGPAVAPTGLLDLSLLDGTNGFAVPGLDPSDNVGITISVSGDINGDGLDDLALGSPLASPGAQTYAGITRVVFGGPTVGAGGSFDLATLNGANGFTLTGLAPNDRCGTSVAIANLNGDGLDDLVSAASYASPAGRTAAGRTYVVFGVADQVWSSPIGGSFDDPSNWLSQRVPSSGAVRIDTLAGVTVDGPNGAVFLDSLTMTAAAGRTTLDLAPGSILHVADPIILGSSAAVTGAGTLVSASQISIGGLLRMDDLGVLAGTGEVGVTVNGRIEVVRGLIDGGMTNSGDIELETLSGATVPNELEVFGTAFNAGTGQILVYGDAILRFRDGLDSGGAIDFVASQSITTGNVSLLLGALSVLDASFLTLADDVDNQASIILSADSTLTILGALTGNGVNAAAATAGPVSLLGGFNPGPVSAPGVASFDGDLNLGPANTTTIEIAGQSDHDQITTLANISAGGTLIVTLVNGFTPSPGDVYQVLTFASASGAFANITLDQSLIDAGADTSTLLIDGRITIPPPPCPGDIDADNDTDVFDFGLLALSFGFTLGDANFNPDADLDDNNTVDVFDFGIFALDFGCQN